MRVLEGKLVASGLKVGIVAARFNEFIVSKLVSGALDGLKRHDVKEEDIDIAWDSTDRRQDGKKQKIRCSDLSWNSDPWSNKPL